MQTSPWNGAWPSAVGWLYLLQTLVNALVLACLYSLVALGYSLIYSVSERINLAFGHLAMLGGFASVTAVGLLTDRLGLALAVTLPLTLLWACATASLYGWASARLLLPLLRRQGEQATLIASLGLALVLTETARLAQGSRDRWLQPPLPQRLTLASLGNAQVSVSFNQIAIVAVSLLTSLILWRILSRSRLGLQLRAVADDANLAALMGVNLAAVLAASFALGGAVAGLGGVILALYYGGINAYAGTLLGFKALTAAVAGGIGSLPGAFLGGTLIALMESFWSAYFNSAYKDLATFAVLALFLILRPHGLLGKARGWHDA
jgi:branched-chain amino acid transport system permease protein